MDPLNLELEIYLREDPRDPYAMPLSDLAEHINKYTGLVQAYLKGVYDARQIIGATLGIDA